MSDKYIYKELADEIKRVFVSRREELNLFIEDVAEITRFHRNTISLIEQTGNPTTSQYFEICLALELNPAECFQGNLRKKSLHKLSASRKENTKLTMRVQGLLSTPFFNSYKTSKDVLNELIENFPETKNVETKNISVILKRMVVARKLVVSSKNPRIHSYKKK